MMDIMVKVSLFFHFLFYQNQNKNQNNKNKGMYFSSSLFYSSRYSKDKDSPNGKPFIICMITPGNVYPGFFSFLSFFSFK